MIHQHVQTNQSIAHKKKVGIKNHKKKYQSSYFYLWINFLINGLLKLNGSIRFGRGGLGAWIGGEGSFLERGVIGWLVTILENDGQTIDVAVHFETLDRQGRQAGQISSHREQCDVLLTTIDFHLVF